MSPALLWRTFCTRAEYKEHKKAESEEKTKTKVITFLFVVSFHPTQGCPFCPSNPCLSYFPSPSFSSQSHQSVPNLSPQVSPNNTITAIPTAAQTVYLLGKETFFLDLFQCHHLSTSIFQASPTTSPQLPAQYLTHFQQQNRPHHQ